MECSIGQLQKIAYKYITRERPLFVHGAPGIGKSDSIRAVTQKIAEEKGLEWSDGKID